MQEVKNHNVTLLKVALGKTSCNIEVTNGAPGPQTMRRFIHTDTTELAHFYYTDSWQGRGVTRNASHFSLSTVL